MQRVDVVIGATARMECAMGMCKWEPSMVRFMRDAASESDYFARVAAKVLDYVGSTGFICDAGCGLGHLSVELSPYCAWVDAVDRAPQALSVLRDMVAQRRISNVDPRLGDYSELMPARPYDAIVFCMSCSIEEAARIALTRCAGTMVVINRVRSRQVRQHAGTGEADGRSLGKATVSSFDERMEGFRRRGIACTGECFQEEIGQPFSSLESAHEFFRIYRTKDYPQGISDAELLDILQPCAKAGWSYYLPLHRRLGLFAFDREAVEQLAVGQPEGSRMREHALALA